jgi:hypothetical protein
MAHSQKAQRDQETARHQAEYDAKKPVTMDEIRALRPGQSVTVKWFYEPDEVFLVLDVRRPSNKSNPPNAILLWAPEGPNSLTDKLWIAVNPRCKPAGSAMETAGRMWGGAPFAIDNGFDAIIRIGSVEMQFK